MISVSRDDFEELVDKAVKSLPKPYLEKIKNVAFIVEDEPNAEQRIELNLRNDQSLFGLYEGVPLSQRQGMTKLMPDKITIFKIPIEHSSMTLDQLYNRIGRTVWHEVAHYFGLDHKRIGELEDKERSSKGLN